MACSIAAVLTTACQLSGAPAALGSDPVGERPSREKTGVPEGHSENVMPTASLTLSVRWPAARSTQVIPEGVRELACRLVPDTSDLPTERRTIPRLVGSVGQATFYGLRPGNWTLFVEGRNTLRELVVAGSTRVHLLPNTRGRALVTLAPPDQPLALRRANPVTAFRGEVVTLDGDGFGATRGASFSLKLGDRAIEGDALVGLPGEPPLGRASDNTLSFRVPADATGGPLVLTIDGQSATLTETIEVIASVSVFPRRLVMGPDDKPTFAVSFLNASGQPVTRPPNGLTGGRPVYDEVPVQVDCGDDEFFSLEAVDALTQSVSVVDAYKGCLKEGFGSFVVGVPPLTATVDIEVRK